jgi:hypothetical protein
MGITMEMYVADQEEFVSIQQRLTAELMSEEEEERLFTQLDKYPQANFSLHLRWPEDIDALCQALITEGLAVPSCASNLLVEELWFDGVSASVHRLSQELPLALAQSTEGTIKAIAERWVKGYILDPDRDPAYYTTAYDAARRFAMYARFPRRPLPEANHSYSTSSGKGSRLSYTAWSTRWRSRARPALPYIVRLISLSFVTCPSTIPLLIGQVSPAFTASLSFSTPAAKDWSSGNSLFVTLASQASNRCPSRL